MSINLTDKILLKEKSWKELEESIVQVVLQGDIELLEYIFTSDEIRNKPSLQQSKQSNRFNYLTKAAMYGTIKSVKWLVCSDFVKTLPISEQYTIAQQKDALKEAAEDGALNSIQFFLCDSEIKNEKDIQQIIDHVLRKICQNSHLYCVQWLLNEPVLQTYVKNHIWDISELSYDINNHFGQRLANYLIFEYDLKITPNLEKDLSYFPEIKQLFDKRELNNKLNNDLKDNKSKQRNIKI